MLLVLITLILMYFILSSKFPIDFQFEFFFFFFAIRKYVKYIFVWHQIDFEAEKRNIEKEYSYIRVYSTGFFKMRYNHNSMRWWIYILRFVCYPFIRYLIKWQRQNVCKLLNIFWSRIRVLFLIFKTIKTQFGSGFFFSFLNSNFDSIISKNLFAPE